MPKTYSDSLEEILQEEARGGSHKSQYIRWMLGRVRGDREGNVYSHKSDEWSNEDNVYKPPYRKEDGRRPKNPDAPPKETPFAGWRPEDWEGRHPPFMITKVESGSKFLKRMREEMKKRGPKYKIPREQIERARTEEPLTFEEEPQRTFRKTPQSKEGKRQYQFKEGLRKFPGLKSKEIQDFRNRVGSKRGRSNTLQELQNVGEFFGVKNFEDKYDTAAKLRPLVEAWERVKGTIDPKVWFKSRK